MYITICIRSARSNLAVIFVIYIVKSERKRSPGTDFAVEDMKENIRAIFVYIAPNLIISNHRKSLEYSKF